jgi:Cu(I)/Ag(I) efflux system membrane protein CusA/SilA
MTYDKLITKMDQALRFPGVTNAWTMPIKNRIDMLSTGIRTAVGIKIYGNDLSVIEQTGLDIERKLKDLPGVRSIYAERAAAGYFLDFELKRAELAQYGLSVEDANETILTAIGGEEVATTLEGRQRYSINVRYERQYRQDVDAMKRVLVSTPSGAQIPIGRIADIHLTQGPSMIRDENGRLCGYVYIDVAGRDIGSFVKDAKDKVSKLVTLPPGTSLAFSGQYENMIRVAERLKIVVPLTLFLIILLLYLNTHSWVKTFIVMTAVPFSLIGAFWFLHLLGYHMSIAVWVGLIALMGLDAETGVFMLLYLDIAYKEHVEKGKMKTTEDLKEAIVEGAVKRVRPKLMTVAAAICGLLPILWSHGAGADVMKRIAAPMVGGLVTSFLLELLIYPVMYLLWMKNKHLR